MGQTDSTMDGQPELNPKDPGVMVECDGRKHYGPVFVASIVFLFLIIFILIALFCTSWKNDMDKTIRALTMITFITAVLGILVVVGCAQLESYRYLTTKVASCSKLLPPQ
jgi:uncharacterized protein YacL